MRSSTQILITGALHRVALEGLGSNPDFSVDYSPDLPRESIKDKIKNKDVLITRSETTVDKELIDAAPKLKVIARAAVGVGNIDIDYATQKGILVINTPGKNTNSAAEMSLALLLAMLRKVPEAHKKLKGGGWNRHEYTGNELRNKAIGIVGLGNVGHRVAKFCHGFDMEVFGFDPYLGPSIFNRHNVKRMTSLADLARKVDVLSVHVPLNKETRGMIDGEILSLLKPGGWVVNAARGGIIEEEAILSFLESGHLAGAAIDTWDDEPSPGRALVEHPKVYVSPHIGASTHEAQMAIGQTIVEQVTKAVEGGVVDFPVNLPRIGMLGSNLLKPYIVLSEKLGSFAAQIIGFNPTHVEILYQGKLADESDHSFIKLGFQKGFASHAANTFVSYVNAEGHFKKLGIGISESLDANLKGYRSSIVMKVNGQKGQCLSVGGIVFDDEYPRISIVNDFVFEVEPNGEFVVMENEDRPGVIGAVGTKLAESHVNIDSFDLARNKKGGRAMAMIKIDSALDVRSKKQLCALEHLTSCHFVSL